MLGNWPFRKLGPKSLFQLLKWYQGIFSGNFLLSSHCPKFILQWKSMKKLPRRMVVAWTSRHIAVMPISCFTHWSLCSQVMPLVFVHGIDVSDPAGKGPNRTYIPHHGPAPQPLRPRFPRMPHASWLTASISHHVSWIANVIHVCWLLMGGSVASKCHPSLRAQLASLNLKGAKSKWLRVASGKGFGKSAKPLCAQSPNLWAHLAEEYAASLLDLKGDKASLMKCWIALDSLQIVRKRRKYFFFSLFTPLLWYTWYVASGF